MSDISYEEGRDPALPPVDLPTFRPAAAPSDPGVTRSPDGRPRIQIYPPKPPSATPPRPADAGPAQVNDKTWYEAAPEYGKAPDAAPGAPAAPPAADGDYGTHAPEYQGKPEPDVPPRIVPGGEAATRGIFHGVTFGAAPAIAGLAAASGIPSAADEAGHPEGFDVNPVRPLVGAYKLFSDWIADNKDPAVLDAYHRGRQAMLDQNKMADEQHPHAYLAGQVAGSLLVPLPGLGAMKVGAGLAGRVAKGGIVGAEGGGLYGAGTAIGEGRPGDVLTDAGKGAATGAIVGGVAGGALGRRAVDPNSPGQRALRTSERLGAPLPRGVVSDSRVTNVTTAKLRQVPIVGDRIGSKVDATQRAAGQHVEDIVGGMAGGAPSRAAADARVRPGLRSIISQNRSDANAAYAAVRARFRNPDQKFPMPRLRAALDGVISARRAAGHANPSAGLEQFENVSNGASFNGAHRARVDAREAGNVLSPHPGYNAADFNRLTRAMTNDLRQTVRDHAIQQGGNPMQARQAVREFEVAEQAFGRIAEQNKILDQLLGSHGEGAIATLLGAAREKGGNLQLLAQLRASMPRKEFEQIGGVLLHELGMSAKTGEFSLAQFTTNMSKVSDHALDVLFSRQHAADIREIAGMGQHIKGALSEASSSHSANLLVMLDLAKDVVLIGHDMASGGFGIGSGLAAGSSGAAVVLGYWLGSPASSAAMRNFGRAMSSIRQGTVTAGKIAAFNVATRNLAHNLNVPVESVLRAVQGHLPAAASDGDQQKND